jgi:hypothetical protein
MQPTASTARRYAAPLDQLRQKSQEFEARMVSIIERSNHIDGVKSVPEFLHHQFGSAAAHAWSVNGQKGAPTWAFFQLASAGCCTVLHTCFCRDNQGCD